MDALSRPAGDPKRALQALWLLTLAGLAIRIAALLVLNDYRSPVTAEYGIVARNLAAGKGFVGGGWLGPEGPTALNVPLYPLYLAAWLRIGGPLPFLGIELSQALFSALLVPLVYGIARRLSNQPTAFLAAALTAVYPPLIYFGKQISPAILAAFAAAASFYTLLVFLDRPTWGKAVLAGVVAGLGLLVEPLLLLALPGSVCIVAWTRRRSGTTRAMLGKLLVCTATCVLVLVPWTVRNYRVFHRFVPLKTSFGLNLWMGNNPSATGFLYTSSGEPMQDTLPAQVRDSLASLDEAERYAVLGREGWAWVRSHPQQFVSLCLRRLGYLWWISPTYQVADQNVVEPRSFYLLRAIIQVPVLLLGVAGGIVAWRKNRLLFLVVVWWLVAFTLPYCISVAGNTRYRLPAEPLLLVWVAFVLVEAVRRWQARKAT